MKKNMNRRRYRLVMEVCVFVVLMATCSVRNAKSICCRAREVNRGFVMPAM